MEGGFSCVEVSSFILGSDIIDLVGDIVCYMFVSFFSFDFIIWLCVKCMFRNFIVVFRCLVCGCFKLYGF